MFVVMYDLRAMPAGHQTFLRQRTFSIPVRRDAISQNNRKPHGHGRTLRYLIHLRYAHCCLWRSLKTVVFPVARTPSSCSLVSNPKPGSRVLSLERSTSIGTSVCCFLGSPWRWTVVLPMSFSLSQSPPSTLHFLLAAEKTHTSSAKALVTHQSQRETFSAHD